MHSFALTERYLVLVTFPLVVNPLQLALSGRPFIENYRWKPELGTTFLVFDRASGELVRTCEAEPCFSFHHINAFERGSEIVIDMASYEDASIVDSLYLDRVRTEAPTGVGAGPRRSATGSPPTAMRCAKKSSATRRSSCPRSTTASATDAPTATSTGSAPTSDGDSPDFVDRLLKIDVENGEELSWFEPGSYPGEPVFVPSPEPDRGEDEGVLLSVVLDSGRGLLVPARPRRRDPDRGRSGAGPAPHPVRVPRSVLRLRPVEGRTRL